MGKALVLGGGGIVGLAWEIGVLTGLRDAGVDLRDADVILGTSTGAIAAAQIVSGVALDELYERQLAPAGAEAAARPHWWVRARVAGTLLTARSPRLGRARVGLIAASSARFSQAVREPLLAAHLPARDWPESTHLVVTAVDARSGAVRAFSRTDGVDLLHAVAASSAVPGLWPPVAVDGRWYIDGGVRSATNADLVAGHERVVVVAPSPRGPLLWRQPVTVPFPEGTQCTWVTPSPESRAAFGRDLFNPARRAAAARAGRGQATEVAVRVARTWGV